MPGLLPGIDPEGLLEYSVVFTDRALNHMSQTFQGVMRDISAALKKVYAARSTVVVPGSGTFAMEAVARQFAAGRPCLIVRNGWFSYRWTQILETGGLAPQPTVLMARRVTDERQAPWVPAPVAEVAAAVREHKPAVVFAPHVETSSGMMLPRSYIREVAEAARAVDGLFVLDCVASGAVWIDMQAEGVDVLISAPQKGWSSSPCAGLVMLGERARERIEDTRSSSFACDLRAWLRIMETYEDGGHAYYATMPTDSLRTFRDTVRETEAYGFERVEAEQLELGARVRKLLAERGFPSVAAEGFEAPGVVVSYTDDDGIRSGKKFAEVGLQIAAGVPLQCGEPEDFRTFRIGLFGLEKLHNIDRTVTQLEKALDRLAT
ncbi:MAG: alanine--glyoxylate aminotransferase family protein [Spirochaetaceae bacterium]|nr:MAG: alanine--glyoxylate aminotransferase family protein [Spirochaetaceae bacterium]